MTLAVVEQELQTAVASLLAEGIITRLFVEIEKLQYASVVDDGWFQTATEVLTFSNSIETGFGHGKAYMLAVIKKNWNELPFSTRKQFGLDFMNFARTWTGKERSTIDNYINTAGIWFLDKICPAEPVKVLERDSEGRPILGEGGKPRYKDVKFNPCLVPLSKLLVVNARAARGEMTDHLWEVLTDPYYTCEDMQTAHANSKVGGEAPDVYFEMIGPGLYLRMGPATACVAEELNWAEYETNLQVKDGIDRLLRLLHIKLDEDYIYDILKEANTVYGDIQ